VTVVAATTVPVESLRPLTYDDLDHFPDDGQRREIITGELTVTAAPTPVHQQIAERLVRLIGNFVELHQLGVLYPAPIDVRLSATDVVEPDLVFISEARSSIVSEKYISGAPDLVAEILSPSSQRTDLVRKRALYAHSGIGEYWIIDPDRKTVQIHRLAEGVYVPVVDAKGQPVSEIFAGLVIDVERLFANIRRIQE
jgi:Uma2 family endonuclease